MKIPTTMGACIDLLYAKRAARDKIYKSAEPLAAEITKLEEHLKKKFNIAKLHGAKGSKASCTVVQTIVPQIEDWSKVYAFIKKNDAFELLQKRMSSEAWRERRAAGKTVPGTEAFTSISIRVNKLSEK